MICRVSELYGKEVICIKDGAKLGLLTDVDINIETGFVEAIVIYGKSRFFGLMGRDDDVIIPWSQIEVIGGDTILVTCETPRVRNRNNNKDYKLFKSFFD